MTKNWKNGFKTYSRVRVCTQAYIVWTKVKCKEEN